MYQVKDFIETATGLLFAVVVAGTESQTVRCFLRYALSNGQWQKLNTEQANRLLAEHYPDYLFYSRALDAHLHGVPENDISRHYAPRSVLKALLTQPAADPVISDLQQLGQCLAEHQIDLSQLGITGSCLLGLQNHQSDLDLVCYDRALFHSLRQVIEQLIVAGKCGALENNDWLEAYQRRACVDLSLDQYIWHEQRKFNKAMIAGRKFDISLISPEQTVTRQFGKMGWVRLEAKVSNADQGFDYPATFVIDHPQITSVVSFTATYNGQAIAGETISVSGQLEINDLGEQRIVVGSNREANGEYIRVINVY